MVEETGRGNAETPTEVAAPSEDVAAPYVYVGSADVPVVIDDNRPSVHGNQVQPLINLMDATPSKYPLPNREVRLSAIFGSLLDDLNHGSDDVVEDSQGEDSYSASSEDDPTAREEDSYSAMVDNRDSGKTLLRILL